MKNIFCILLLMTSSSQALAWGGRGHDTICRVASFLVKEPGLKEYLQNKPQMMGHLCNMPDFYWKSLGGDAVKFGSPAHFIDIEVFRCERHLDGLQKNYRGLHRETGSIQKRWLHD